MTGGIACAICGHTDHVLVRHIQEAHGLHPKQYVEKHQAPVFSAEGAKVIQEQIGGAALLSAPYRPSEMKTVEEVFDWPGESLKVRRYEGTTPFVPGGDDDGYKYNFNASMTVMLAMSRTGMNNVWIKGDAGTGKSELVVNMARRWGRELFRINFDSAITRAEIVGDWGVKDGKTVFNYGILPIAMKRGGVLLMDEFDLINPYLAPVFRPVLEKSRRLVILENGAEVIDAHPEFVVMVTANSWACGDETGMYAITNNLSVAELDRFHLFEEMDYLEPAVEAELVCDAVPELPADRAALLVQIAGSIRALHREKRIERPLSTRQLVSWARTYVDYGDVTRAADLTFIHPRSEGERVAIREVIAGAGL